MSAPPQKAIAVLGFDSAMFEQASQCIATIRDHCRQPIEIGVVAIDLSNSQLAWLAQQQITVFTDCRSLPFYAAAPAYAYAMTCRPFLPQIFPGYEVYLWVDADIRFTAADAFDFYLTRAAAEPHAVAISQEIDPAYFFVKDPHRANAYHTGKQKRLTRVYGEMMAAYLQHFYLFNAGLFAMHRDCPTWAAYRRNMLLAMKGDFDHMADQDALTVAIFEDGMNVHVAPPTMNWLCSAAMPAFDESQRAWVRPTVPRSSISAMHLTNSSVELDVEGKRMSYYKLYRRLGLTN